MRWGERWEKGLRRGCKGPGRLGPNPLYCTNHSEAQHVPAPSYLMSARFSTVPGLS